MKYKPMIFTTETVKAILEGHKTQTRRPVKGKHLELLLNGEHDTPEKFYQDKYGDSHSLTDICPYGQVGDRIWVKETFQYDDGWRIAYKASPETWPTDKNGVTDGSGWMCWDWRPSIHMPRWASRIALEITDIRVERVQGITPEDVKAEGVDLTGLCEWQRKYGKSAFDINEYYKIIFENLWNKIYLSRGYGWDKNPWVWVIGFKVVDR